jgi:hypothetical protein
MNTPIRCYEVNVKGQNWSTTINASTAGKAKYRYLLDVQESWQGVTFKDLTCRVVGRPQSSERFINNAKYRSLPDARCGDRVRVGDSMGYIVGHNSSANFDIEFDSGKYAGLVLNVHPQEMEIINDKQ